MQCSLIGLSPSDFILQGIESRVIKTLLQLINNRFDIKALVAIREEIDHTIQVIDSMVYDYENREDRVLSKKMSVAAMSAFGGEANKTEIQQNEKRLANAKKVFTGNMNINGQVIAVGNERAREILVQLHKEKSRLLQIRNTIFYNTFTDNIYFGKPLTWWANSRSHRWLSAYAAERLERQDNLSSMIRDAEGLLSHVDNQDKVELIIVKQPSFEELTTLYSQLSGNLQPDADEHELMGKFLEALKVRDLTAIGQDAVSALMAVFIYCLLASKQHDDDVAEKLEQCGLYFMNPVRAEYMLSSLADLTLVPEREISLKDLKQGDSYEVLLGAIIAACENDMTPIGAQLEGRD